jgi:hypothetical protein
MMALSVTSSAQLYQHLLWVIAVMSPVAFVSNNNDYAMRPITRLRERTANHFSHDSPHREFPQPPQRSPVCAKREARTSCLFVSCLVVLSDFVKEPLEGGCLLEGAYTGFNDSFAQWDSLSDRLVTIRLM